MKENNSEQAEFDRMEEMFDRAHREEQEVKAAQAMENTRAAMVMGKKPQQAFFASLVIKLKYSPDWGAPTACTDGEWVRYNPDFVLGLPPDQLRGVHAHEVMHCVLDHMCRRKWREPFKFNVAADLAINPVLVEAGYKLPDSCLMPGKKPFADPKYKPGLSAEEYYRLLPDDLEGLGDSSDPGGCGGVEDHKQGKASEADRSAVQQAWQMAVNQAAEAAKQRGQVSAGLDLFIKSVLTARVDWRNVLRDFIVRHAKNEYRWDRPNRRHLWRDIYLPTLRGERIDGIVVANDTSGSMHNVLTLCAGEIDGIARQVGAHMTILHHDSQVCHVQEWGPEDGTLSLEIKGGGGTSHIPVFDWIKTNMLDQDREVACLVCLSDMYSAFPAEAPDYPVLWVSTTRGAKPPFGMYIEVGEDD